VQSGISLPAFGRNVFIFRAEMYPSEKSSASTVRVGECVSEGRAVYIFRVDNFSSTLKLEAARRSETLVTIAQTVRYNIPQDINLHSHRRYVLAYENLSQVS
jgi:hypothetical protein